MFCAKCGTPVQCLLPMTWVVCRDCWPKVQAVRYRYTLSNLKPDDDPSRFTLGVKFYS